MSELLIVAAVLCTPEDSFNYYSRESARTCFTEFVQCLTKAGYPANSPEQLKCFQPKEKK